MADRHEDRSPGDNKASSIKDNRPEKRSGFPWAERMAHQVQIFPSETWKWKLTLETDIIFFPHSAASKTDFWKIISGKKYERKPSLFSQQKNTLYPLYSQIPAGSPDQPAVRQNRPWRHWNRVIWMNFKQRHEAEGNSGWGMKHPAVNNGIQRMNEKEFYKPGDIAIVSSTINGLPVGSARKTPETE